MTRRCRNPWPDRGRGLLVLSLPALKLYLSGHIMFELLLSHFVHCISRFVRMVKYYRFSMSSVSLLSISSSELDVCVLRIQSRTF